MAKKNIGAYITLDGEKEFRTATSACNKSVGTLRSEMKLVEAQTEGNANTLDALKKKHDSFITDTGRTRKERRNN